MTEPSPQPPKPSFADEHDRTGVVIVDHGSTRDESNRMLEDFVEMFRQAGRFAIVEPAHMELAEPSIQTAFDRCVEQGAQRVVVAPYFLSPGRHWYKDIPRLVAQAARKHPGVNYLVTAPIGLHPLMCQLIGSRIDHCLQHAAGRAPECDVCRGTGRCRSEPSQPPALQGKT
jgi:sirohydrochlorin ferrochelatase